MAFVTVRSLCIGLWVLAVVAVMVAMLQAQVASVALASSDVLFDDPPSFQGVATSTEPLEGRLAHVLRPDLAGHTSAEAVPLLTYHFDAGEADDGVATVVDWTFFVDGEPVGSGKLIIGSISQPVTVMRPAARGEAHDVTLPAEVAIGYRITTQSDGTGASFSFSLVGARVAAQDPPAWTTTPTEGAFVVLANMAMLATIGIGVQNFRRAWIGRGTIDA